MTQSPSGIATLLADGRPALEHRIRAALNAVSTDAELAATYVDPADRLRVRRRAAIAAVLDTIFNYDFEEHNAPNTVILAPDPRGVEALLGSARLDFLHDRTLLDVGLPAELVLRPVGRETVDGKRGIKPSRKLMILGLALIELWQAADAQGFTKRTEVQALVAECLVSKPSTIKTQRSNFANNQKCSPEEHAHYNDTLDLVRNMARGSTHPPFALLLPAFRALCDAGYPRETSASR